MTPAAGSDLPLRRCAHTNCGCRTAAATRPYCGAYCANAARDQPPEGACACGHAACSGSQHVARAGSEVQTSVGPDPEAGAQGSR